MGREPVGFAVECDGMIQAYTVCDDRAVTIQRAFQMRGYILAGNCEDPKCGCMDAALAEMAPGSKVVEVKIVKVEA